MIVSVHLADIGARAALAALRDRPHPGNTPGLRYAETTITGGIAAGLPKVRLGRAALIAAWEDDAALDRFLAEDPTARRLARGWHVRLQPLRVSGSWSPMPVDIAPAAALDDEDGPVAVLTLGRLRLRRAVPFLRANSRASGQAAADPSMVASIALARPPRFVATFSIWRSESAMSRYAYGTAQPRQRGVATRHESAGNQHKQVIKQHQADPFHHEAAFVRFRPYASQGTLDGREPVAAAMAAATQP
ncbi:spheroidene monooxygenase [Streptomyces piniterrae]|uniref:Spheroidene monooxygenase n=1 Tax=Streptomyces piniterrae TaxID=2571125 RepID=A0A4U0MQF7_9ACTN|nr:spheroidene monooxygenase [Streptomyces piniterrae]TJZ42806.1 spheroidene monooxygenase [Streptomyces piniterrae]